jgi:formylglycine-generating enzyme required for sulfatase activity
MGYADERPQHQVHIDYNFEVAQTQVTQALYEAVTGHNPSHFQGDKLESGDDNHDRPVEQISWYDALAFCNQLSDFSDLTPAYDLSGEHPKWINRSNGYRLPTEAEWECFATSGEHTSYAGGENVDHVAWHGETAHGLTHSVAQLTPNSFGLYDCSGNVWEWCYDQWHPQAYKDRGDEIFNPVTHQIEVAEGKPREHVARGGSWFGESDQCRVSYRASFAEDYTVSTLGLRLVRGPANLALEHQEESEEILTAPGFPQGDIVSPGEFAPPELTMPAGDVTAPIKLAMPEQDSHAPESVVNDNAELAEPTSVVIETATEDAESDD